MGNKEDGAENLTAFLAWPARQSDDCFRQMTRGGRLKRSEISKGAGITRQCLTKNAKVKAAVDELGQTLRERGALPPLWFPEQPTGDSPRRHDPQIDAPLKAEQRASALEQEVVALRAAVAQLKASLSRHRELRVVIGELGLPSMNHGSNRHATQARARRLTDWRALN